MTKFELGQNPLDVCKIIVDHQKEIKSVMLISHEVGVNWRQRCQSVSDKANCLLKGFEHIKQLQEKEYSREEFGSLAIEKLTNLEKNQVWSFTSKVKCTDGEIRHVPMMNFHPETKSTKEIKRSLKYICGENKGVLLDSGRFFHYYGDFLLNETDWIKFMAEFLMPIIIVSPRYIGHRLYAGFCSLRLTTDSQYKPKIPEVIEIL